MPLLGVSDEHRGLDARRGAARRLARDPDERVRRRSRSCRSAPTPTPTTGITPPPTRAEILEEPAVDHRRLPPRLAAASRRARRRAAPSDRRRRRARSTARAGARRCARSRVTARATSLPNAVEICSRSSMRTAITPTSSDRRLARSQRSRHRAAKTSCDEDAVARRAVARGPQVARASAPATPAAPTSRRPRRSSASTVRKLVGIVPNAFWKSALSGPEVRNAVVRDT